MCDYSENRCYLALVRPPSKTIRHFFTGESQIQRVASKNDHQWLQYSIRHSKMLAQYKNKYPYYTSYVHEQAEQICRIKQIKQAREKFYVQKILKELHCFQYTVHRIAELKKTKYDKGNKGHQQKLLSIWSNLKPKEKLQSRISDQWINIGFQVNDPATDFRGSGYLGLLNLYRYSMTKKCGRTFKIASDSSTEYFFCSAGLYFTMLASQILQRKMIEYTFWVHESEQQLLNNFQILYEMIFEQFSVYWLTRCDNKTIMYFNQNLKNFEKQAKKWSRFTIRQKIAKYQN